MLRVVGDSTEAASSENHAHFAAVDLGSNSFRLQIGRVIDDQIYPMDSIKEQVLLASGITPDKRLDTAAQQRALIALRRFGERLRGFEASTVRVVGTNALRVARNAQDFLPLAEEALGFPIEIIAGREEARLIYIGVGHSLPPSDGKRLVIDIGGGSTEFIIGRQMKPLLTESLYMGCVSYSMRFFAGGKMDKKSFREAEMAAGQGIECIAVPYGQLAWNEVIGSSGTARTIANLLELNEFNPGGVSGITRHGLEMLRRAMIQAGSVDRLELRGLPSERLAILPGGVAIMCAVFAGLGIEQLHYAGGALRLGVLYDLLGRFHQRDMRDTTVRQFKRRYHVDLRQSLRVERTATELFDQLHGPSARVGTHEKQERENARRLLQWAAALHEVGISVAHGGYHKHGAYILGSADMPGFSNKDQAKLARIVLGQRGKLEKLDCLPKGDALWSLVFCLRLAVLLHRSRDDRLLSEVRVKLLGAPTGVGYQVEMSDSWLNSNPLTAAALRDESMTWQNVGVEFRIEYTPERLSATA